MATAPHLRPDGQRAEPVAITRARLHESMTGPGDQGVVPFCCTTPDSGVASEVEMSISASEARKNLFPLLEKVNDDRTPIEITSRHGNAVLVSKDDWDALEETAYLLRSPENARRLLAELADARSGEGPEVRRTLEELRGFEDEA